MGGKPKPGGTPDRRLKENGAGKTTKSTPPWMKTASKPTPKGKK